MILFNFIIFFASIFSFNCKYFNIKTSKELINALKNVDAGDSIILEDGIYEGSFKSNKSGTENKRIILKGSKNAILTNPKGDGLKLKGSYWKLDGFTVCNSSRGILLDYSTYNLLTNLFIHHIGHAAVKFRSNSTDNTIQFSTISYTGMDAPENGEAVYVGSSISHWDDNGESPDFSNRNKIINNKFGPFVSAESADIKEGTEETIFENNIIDGHGMSDENYSNTWVSVKGTKSVIKNNIGIFSVLDGFSVRSKPNKFIASGCYNKFINNTCSNLANNGKCINFIGANCLNEDINNKLA